MIEYMQKEYQSLAASYALLLTEYEQLVRAMDLCCMGPDESDKQKWTIAQARATHGMAMRVQGFVQKVLDKPLDPVV